MIEIFLLRHGESTKNVLEKHGFSTKKYHLTSKGIEQIFELSKLFPIDKKIDKIFCSTTDASIETADLLNEKINSTVEQSSLFNSLNMGILSDMSFDEMKLNYPEYYNKIRLYEKGELHPKNFNFPKSETQDNFENRIRQQIDILLTYPDNSSLVFIGHRSPITMFLNIIENKFQSVCGGVYKKIDLPILSITRVLIDKSNLSNSKIAEIGIPHSDFFKKKYTLGLNYGSHDSSIAVSNKNKLIFASEEERFCRIKKTTEIPIKSIEYFKTTFKVSDYNFSQIVLSNNPKLLSDNEFNKISSESEMFCLKSKAKQLELIKDKLKEQGLFQFNAINISYINHHLAHAATAYLMSKFKNATVLTIDGIGERQTIGIYSCKKEHVKLEDIVYYPHSIGKIYGSICRYLGFYSNTKEGHVMALSALGTPKHIEQFEKFIIWRQQNILPQIDVSYFDFSHTELKPSLVGEKFIKLFGSPRSEKEELTEKHFDLAASLQLLLQNVVKRIVENIIYKYKPQNICFSGGVFMNCKLNGELMKCYPNINFFIPNAPHDGGLSIGASFYKKNNSFYIPRNKLSDYVFAGLDVDFQDMSILFADAEIDIIKSSNIVKDTALLIEKKGVVFWLQNKAEFGPRALGNRCILADPRRLEIVDFLNKKVKGRCYFMPFAPSLLEERSEEIVGKHISVPFMNLAIEFSAEWRKLLPAIVHVDNSSRIQTVSKSFNELFHLLIEEFYLLTGIPVLLNTSFNLNDEPIVNSLKDAINCFKKSPIDTLVYLNYIITKRTDE